MIDPETDAPYKYEVTGDLSFRLCASFSEETKDLSGQGSYPMRDMAYPSTVGGDSMNNNWKHGVGETCFDRTIDPEIYRPYPKPL